MQGPKAPCVRPMVPHQELAMASALDDLRHATACSPASLQAQHPPLLRVALARGRHMSEVLDLKQRNLQASRFLTNLGPSKQMLQRRTSAIGKRCLKSDAGIHEQALSEGYFQQKD